MKRVRIPIAGLVALVALASMAFAAVTIATAAWAGALFSLTFFLLLAALLGIGFGRGPRRVFWVGFALLGWGYMALCYVPLGGRYFGPLLFGPNLFDALYVPLHVPPEAGESGPIYRAYPPWRPLTPRVPPGAVEPGMGGMGAGSTSGMGAGYSPPPPTGGGFRSMMAGFSHKMGEDEDDAAAVRIADIQDFYRIGVALEALLWATLGGWAARYFASGRKGAEGAAGTPPAAPEVTPPAG